MRVLVIGGTGYLGQALVQSLVASGHQVSVVARSKASISGARLFSGDAIRMDWSEPLDDVQAVVNVLGIIRQTPSATFEAVHVEVVARLVAAMQLKGVSRLIHISALGTRANARAQYHQSKWRGEQRIADTEGLSYTILRPSLVFGGGSPFFRTLGQIASTPLGAMIPGNGQGLFEPVYRGDVVAMVSAALADEARTRGETFELGGPERFSLNDLVQHVVEVRQLGPVAFHHLPLPWLSRVARWAQGFSAFPVTPDQLLMLTEDNVTEDTRWHEWVKPTHLAKDL